MVTDAQKEQLREFAETFPPEFLELVLALPPQALDILYPDCVPVYIYEQARKEIGALEEMVRAKKSPFLEWLGTKGITPAMIKAEFADLYPPEEPT